MGKGGEMKSRAAVAWEAGKPLVIEEVEVSGPKDGEVLLQVAATGVCHTDAFTLSGQDPEGLFRAIMSFRYIFPNAANANSANRAGPISAARSGLPKVKACCPTARRVFP